MKFSFFNRFGWGGVCLLLTTMAIGQPTTPPAPLNQTFVRVNGADIPVSHAEVLLREQLGRGQPNTPELQAVVRETLINQTLMAQEATKAGMDKLPLMEAQLALMRQQLLAQAWQQSLLQGMQFSEADLKAEYTRQTGALGPNEFRLRHILVGEEATARLLIERLGTGGQFAQLAKEYSQDEGSKNNGGLTEWTPQGQLVPAVREALTGLKKGELRKTPVRTPQGWHVLIIEDSRPYSPPAQEQVRPQLVQALAQQQLQQAIQKLRNDAKVE